MPQHQAGESAGDIALADDDLAAAARWVISHCRQDAEEALCAGMETVEILRPLGMDDRGLLAALLQPLLPISARERGLLAARFGKSTLSLLHGAARMRQLSALSQSRDEFANPRVNEENLRKMLIAMVDDVRVVLIELARHLSLLQRSKEADRAVREPLGRLTLEVYAPLANRLGVRQLKWRMEDYALRCMAPQDYRELAQTLDEKRIDREQYIGEFIDIVQHAIEQAAIVAEVQGRPKHLYSIWRKMRHKGLAFDNLRDVRAVRILVDDEADCYAALAVVHANWQPLPGEFDDYIATPKENGYRSLHSVILGPRQQAVEVQIRTREMHRQSEFGVAAHWRYKENVQADEGIDHKLARLRQLLQWKETLPLPGERSGEPVAAERVYAFTPKGTVIDLPAGATPIDFAYAIHTEVGHCTRGARVNGKMVPLGHPLQTGDQVHIQTMKGGCPSRDWLRQDLGQVRTRRARNRIAQWFKRADYDQHLADGRAMLERELSRLGMTDLSYDAIARRTHFHKTDDMLAALGANDFKLSKALAPFRRAAADTPASAGLSAKPHRRREFGRPGNLRVHGVGNLLTRMANCCRPVPGDDIVGFITTGHGVSIHRRNCGNMRNLDELRRSRLVEVQWSESEAGAYPVEIRISAYQRAGLLSEITQLLKDENIVVIKLNRQADDEQGADILLRLEISDLNRLSRIMRRLARIPDVLRVRRAGGGEFR